MDISTHSLTKRLTKSRQGKDNARTYFNSQPHEEADNPIRQRYDFERYFNSQPHEEADN